MTTAPIEQRRILATVIPGPRSVLLQKRKMSAVSAGIGTGLPIYVEGPVAASWWMLTATT